MDYWHLFLPVTLLLLLILSFLVIHFRKKATRQKVQSLSTQEKEDLLNRLAEPLGYYYDSRQDIFVSRLDAPQKHFGYMLFYDLSAPYFNMIFDYETIYFNYNHRTWLIEMWKGQYGINAGCELGVYYADTIIPPDQYDSTLFHAVELQDMPEIAMRLYRTDTMPVPTNLGQMRDRHWWLTIFKMGTFAKPARLYVETSIGFPDYAMLRSFLESFERALPDTLYRINGLTVYFTFRHSMRKYSFYKRLVRKTGLAFCKLYCKWFLSLTRSFDTSGDRLLYLYYYLPFIIRVIIHPKQKNLNPPGGPYELL